MCPQLICYEPVFKCFFENSEPDFAEVNTFQARKDVPPEPINLFFENASLQILATKLYVMLCAIWHHLHNLKKGEKYPRRSVTFSKVLHECFPCFLNCVNDTKLRNASYILE